MKKIQFKISRYKPAVIDPPAFFTYTLKVSEHMTVLDCLEQIRIHQEPGLMYRHSCHHASCGTCGCIINNVERLACLTNVFGLDAAVIVIEPLKGFERVGDLVVDRTAFFRDIAEDWDCLRPSETAAAVSWPAADAGATPSRFENCIECGCCVSACPAAHGNTGFLGPAVLAAVNRERLNHPGSAKDLLDLAAGENGERRCERALACSRVCPTGVYPARHIADLRRAIKSRA